MKKEALSYTKEIEVLNQGGIGIFPTDTAFAIGCRIDDTQAVERLFAIKGRDIQKSLPVLVDSVAMAENFVCPFDSHVKKNLIETFWPGALTIVQNIREGKVLPIVTGGKDTMGVRLPNHDIARTLISGTGVPLVGTSANFAGEPTPFSTEQIDPVLLSRVDFFIPGECPIRSSSTVIDVTTEPWNVIRQGAVNFVDR